MVSEIVIQDDRRGQTCLIELSLNSWINHQKANKPRQILPLDMPLGEH